MFSAVRLGFGSIKNRSRDPQSSWQAPKPMAAVTGKNQKNETPKKAAPNANKSHDRSLAVS